MALITISTLVIILLRKKATPVRTSYRPRGVSNDLDMARSGFDQSLVQSKWVEIQTMQNSGPSGLKASLVEADKLLDYCMIGRGFAGDTMGERLKTGGSQFHNLNAVWSAHKLRNQLAHEVDHDLVPSQVKRAIEDLGSAIKDLGIRI